MKRIVFGCLALWWIGTTAYAQEKSLNLGSRKLDISMLDLRYQQQFEQDYRTIMASPSLREAFQEDVLKVMNNFSGSEAERTQLLAKLARRLVSSSAPEETSVAPSRDPITSQAPTQLTKSVRVSTEVLARQASTADPHTSDAPLLPKSETEDTAVSSTQPSNFNRPRVFQGQISYEIPDSMKVGEPELIRLVVSIDPALAEELARVGQGALLSESVGIGKYMRAELLDFGSFSSDDRNFLFKLWEGDSIQAMDLNNPEAATTWEWTVKPLKSGKLTLGVKVSIILFDEQLPNRMDFRSLDTYQKAIHIQSTSPKKAIAKLNDMPKGFLWVVGVVLLVVATFVLGRWLHTRRLQKAAAAETTELSPEAIRNLIKEGAFEKSAEALLAFASLQQFEDDAPILALQARIHHWRSDIHNNVIDGEEARQERSRITLALLHLLEEVEEAKKQG